MIAIAPGSTDVTIEVFIPDSSSTTGGGKTALAYNTSSLTAYYARSKSASTAITLATQTVTGSHSDGGFVEIDATNMPGIYRLDLPDAVCASGVSDVVIYLQGASGVAPTMIRLWLTYLAVNTVQIEGSDATDQIGDAVWDEALSGHTTTGSSGKKLIDIGGYSSSF